MKLKMGFVTFLTIIFVILKIAGAIEWSWLWVLSPLWIPAAFVIGVAVFILGFALTITVIALIVSLIVAIFEL